MGKNATWMALGLAGLLLAACQKGPPWKPPAPTVKPASTADTPRIAGVVRADPLARRQ
ncbi:MAG: hypothetical protein ACI83P_002615 [Janthinobacterium sp.]|jgi:hypothetical protein